MKGKYAITVVCKHTGKACGPEVRVVVLVWQVMKAVSGKFHPIFQWFYFDSVESLPENLPLPPEEVDLQVGVGSDEQPEMCLYVCKGEA